MYRNLIPGDHLKDFILANQWFLPALVLVPMGIGIFLQNKFIKTAQDWTV